MGFFCQTVYIYIHRTINISFHFSDGVEIIHNEPNASCIATKDKKSFDCCIESKVLGRNLWMNFTLDPCNYRMEMNLENIQQKYALLGYEWGRKRKDHLLTDSSYRKYTLVHENSNKIYIDQEEGANICRSVIH
jgi:hypothetical protein